MRHAIRSQRLSLPTDHRKALLNGLVKDLVIHGQIRTTYAKAREAQRLADRLVTLGKEGSIHSRRRAFRTLQNRTLVKQLFADIAPRFTDVAGGYTRVVRLALRRGDGAQLALLSFSRLPAGQPALLPTAKSAQPKQAPPSIKTPQPKPESEGEKPKGFFEGLRNVFTRKRKE